MNKTGRYTDAGVSGKHEWLSIAKALSEEEFLSHQYKATSIRGRFEILLNSN